MLMVLWSHSKSPERLLYVLYFLFGSYIHSSDVLAPAPELGAPLRSAALGKKAREVGEWGEGVEGVSYH